MAKHLLGFTNSDERFEFAIEIRKGIEKAAASSGDFELIWRDNASDTATAMQNIEEFAHRRVDLSIIYHFDEKVGAQLVTPLRQKQIPIIAIEHPLPTATFLGIDDEIMGRLAAEEVGMWVRDNWDGKIDQVVVLIDSYRLSGQLKRFTAAIQTLKQYVRLRDDQTLYLDSTSQSATAAERFVDVLNRWAYYHRIVVMTASDDLALSIIQTARLLNREADLAVIGGNGLKSAIEEFKKPFSRLLASPTVYPYRYGEYLIDLSRKILNGEKVPQKNWIQPVLLSRGMFERFSQR